MMMNLAAVLRGRPLYYVSHTVCLLCILPFFPSSPEFMAFNDDGSQLYLNLQVNSALVRIDTNTGQALSVDGYGLKPATSGAGFDIVKDGECKLVTNSCLYLGRTPDGIFSLQYEGKNYVLTADEGSDYDLGDYEEKFDSHDLFLKNGTFALDGWTFGENVIVPGDSSLGCSANFNEECESLGLEWCSNFEMTVGSSAVDYSDPTSPKLNRIVGFGGRGIAVFEVPESTFDRITLVWDSVRVTFIAGAQRRNTTVPYFPTRLPYLPNFPISIHRPHNLNKKFVTSSLGQTMVSKTKHLRLWKVRFGY